VNVDPRGALACLKQRGEFQKEPLMEIRAALFDS
jgi:hypothetical protein